MPDAPIVNQPEVIDTDPARTEPTGQAWNRTLRTAVQAGFIQICLTMWQEFAPAAYVMSDGQYAIASTFLTALVTLLMVAGEDAIGMAFLRTPSGRQRRRARTA